MVVVLKKINSGYVFIVIFCFLIFCKIISILWQGVEIFLYGYSQESLVDAVISVYFSIKLTVWYINKFMTEEKHD